MKYAAYAIDTYVQRQLLHHKSNGVVPRVYKSHMRGIEATTLLHADGTKVSTTTFNPLTVIRAKDRLQLTEDNCVLMRVEKATKKVAVGKEAATSPAVQQQETIPTHDPASVADTSQAAQVEEVLHIGKIAAE